MEQSFRKDAFTEDIQRARSDLVGALGAVASAIEGLRLDAKPKSYLSDLLTLDGFIDRFGYPSSEAVSAWIPRIADHDDEYSVRGHMRNVLSRRAFFYLAKLKEDWAAHDSPQLRRLIDFFSMFKRSVSYTATDIIDAMRSNYDYELAPLYETFVDAELFTALLHLSAIERQTHEGALHRKQLLTRKVRGLLQSHLTKSYTVRQHHFQDIKDEANLMWGICILYRLQGPDFGIHARKGGRAEFEHAFFEFLSRPPQSRRSPGGKDIIFEVTPELYTLNRTCLYILDNALTMLCEPSTERTTSFADGTRTYLDRMIQQHILDAPTSNLYYQCLQYRCLSKYVQAFECAAEMPLSGRIHCDVERGLVLLDNKPVNLKPLSSYQRKVLRHCMELKARGTEVLEYNKMPDKPISRRLVDVFRHQEDVYKLLFENQLNQVYRLKF